MDINLNIHYKNVCFNSKFNINSMIGDILESSMSYHRLIIYDIYGIYLKKDDNIEEYIGTDDFPFHLKISRLISEYGNIENLYIIDKETKILDNISDRIRANYMTYLGVKEDENMIAMYSNRQQRYQVHIPGSYQNPNNSIQYMIPVNYGNIQQNVNHLNNLPTDYNIANGGSAAHPAGGVVDGLNEDENILDENEEMEDLIGEYGEPGIDDIYVENGEDNSLVESSDINENISNNIPNNIPPNIPNNIPPNIPNNIPAYNFITPQPNVPVNNNIIYEYIYNIPSNMDLLSNVPINTMQVPINPENNDDNYQPGQVNNNVNNYFNNLMNTLFSGNFNSYRAIIQRLNQLRQNQGHIPSTEEEYNEFLGSLNIESNANILDFLHELTSQLRTIQMEDVAIVTDDKEIDNLICDKYKNLRDTHEIEMCSCGITLEDFEDDSDVVILPCKHAFMKDSIFTWLKDHSNKCPVCRKEIGKGVPKLE